MKRQSSRQPHGNDGSTLPKQRGPKRQHQTSAGQKAEQQWKGTPLKGDQKDQSFNKHNGKDQGDGPPAVDPITQHLSHYPPNGPFNRTTSQLR